MFLMKKIILATLLITSSYISLHSEKTITTSCHLHSTHSDGKNTIKEIIEQAQKLNLDIIGISDHYILLPDGLKASYSIQDLDTYIADVLSFSKYTNPNEMLGIEADYFPETIDALREQLADKPFDYVIGSIHRIDGFKAKFVFESGFSPPDSVDQTIKKYWTLIREMAESGVFDVVAHMDLTKRLRMRSPCDFSQEIDAAFDAIKAADMTVELNTSGWHHPCQEQYPSRELLEKCKQRDIPIMVTSDAHSIEHLTRNFEKAYELLIDIGYTQVAYYTKRQRFFTQIPEKLSF